MQTKYDIGDKLWAMPKSTPVRGHVESIEISGVTRYTFYFDEGWLSHEGGIARLPEECLFKTKGELVKFIYEQRLNKANSWKNKYKSFF